MPTSSTGTQWRTPVRRTPGSGKFLGTPPKFSISEEDRKSLDTVRSALECVRSSFLIQTTANRPLKSSMSTLAPAPDRGPTEDRDENPFYVPTSTVVENDQVRSVKKRRTDRQLNVTFAPSPPSSPIRIRFAEVTQIKRDTSNTRLRLFNYTSTPANHKSYGYAQKPPSAQELVSTADCHGIPDTVYQGVFYSKETDAPDHAKEYAGILFRIHSGTGLSVLEEWEGGENTPVSRPRQQMKGPLRLSRIVGIGGWEYHRRPPSLREVRRWLPENQTPAEIRMRRATWASQVNPCI